MIRKFELPKNADGIEIMIEATDDPDENGVNHLYQIYQRSHGIWETAAKIRFKKAPSAFGDGSSAVTEEALLAVVLDRFQGMLRGSLFTPMRANASVMLEKAIGALRGERDVVVKAAVPEHVEAPTPKIKSAKKPTKVKAKSKA